jgi:hypothetical protein
MLVLEPIFEADLPPEQYAYRPGRNAQQAVVEVEALLFRGRPDLVDPAPLSCSPDHACLFAADSCGRRSRSSSIVMAYGVFGLRCVRETMPCSIQ